MCRYYIAHWLGIVQEERLQCRRRRRPCLFVIDAMKVSPLAHAHPDHMTQDPLSTSQGRNLSGYSGRRIKHHGLATSGREKDCDKSNSGILVRVLPFVTDLLIYPTSTSFPSNLVNDRPTIVASYLPSVIPTYGSFPVTSRRLESFIDQ